MPRPREPHPEGKRRTEVGASASPRSAAGGTSGAVLRRPDRRATGHPPGDSESLRWWKETPFDEPLETRFRRRRPAQGTQPPGIGVGPVFVCAGAGAGRERESKNRAPRQSGRPFPAPTGRRRDGPPPDDSGFLRRSKGLDSRNLISLEPGVRRPRRRSAGRRRRLGPKPGGRSVFIGSGTRSDGSGRDSGVVPETTGVPGACGPASGSRSAGRESKNECRRTGLPRSVAGDTSGEGLPAPTGGRQPPLHASAVSATVEGTRLEESHVSRPGRSPGLGVGRSGDAGGAGPGRGTIRPRSQRNRRQRRSGLRRRPRNDRRSRRPGPTGRRPASRAPPGAARSRRRRCSRRRCTRGGNG